MAQVAEKDAGKAVEKDKSLNMALAQIEKQYGKGSIMSLGSQKVVDDGTAISTGALSVDLAIGIGGVPRRRVVEIFGPESSGKTTLALQIVANAQKTGGVAAYVDAEYALDPQYAKNLGVNLETLLVSQPDCGEDALNIVETLVSSNSLDVIVIDSVSALVPRAEIEGDIGDSHVGLQARLMSQALRKLTSIISRSKTCVIFINQIREKIGVMFGSNETTSGGRALKFYASVRLDVRRIGAIKDSKGEHMGNRTLVKVVKNKVAPPFRQAEFEIYYNQGISAESSILDLGVLHGVVERKGTWYVYHEERLGQGKDQARLYLQNEKKICHEIVEKIKVAAGIK
ncbi:MAG: recombinase RecA [Chlamydiota bacterium]|nr:recombinase RecA [Chlamydiota bacterium]